MYPLENWKTLKRGYLFGQPTSYNAHHLGVDILCAIGTKVYAPCDGTAVASVGPEAGNQIRLTTVDGKYIIRFLHLSKVLKTGIIKQGDLIALSGNTGTNTTGPHLHVDISKGHVDIYTFANFVDPEIFLKPQNTMFKLALINLDFQSDELPKFKDALLAEVSRLSGGKFPLEMTWIEHPRTDALQNISTAPAGAATGMKLEYINTVVNEAKVAGYHTVGIIYHLPLKLTVGPQLVANLATCRPMAYGATAGQQMLSAWFWNKTDLPDEASMIPGWLWAVIHELCHSVFSRLNDMGIHERDTTHDGNAGDFSDEFTIFNKYIAQLTGGVSTPTVPTPPSTPPSTYPMIDFRKGDKSGDIFMQGADGKWHKFLEYSIYSSFAQFGKVTTIPQVEMDGLPKGDTIAFVLDDLK